MNMTQFLRVKNAAPLGPFFFALNGSSRSWLSSTSVKEVGRRVFSGASYSFLSFLFFSSYFEETRARYGYCGARARILMLERFCRSVSV